MNVTPPLGLVLTTPPPVQASTFNNVLTSGLQSLWLLHLLADRIRLPSPTAINKVRA